MGGGEVVGFPVAAADGRLAVPGPLPLADPAHRGHGVGRGQLPGPDPGLGCGGQVEQREVGADGGFGQADAAGDPGGGVAAAAQRAHRLGLVHRGQLRAPEDAAAIQRVLAIEGSQATRTDISWLTDAEAGALLAACDRATWIGRRDHAMILTALRTGLRVSELTHLTCDDVRLGAGAHVHCVGKGRKERCAPLDKPTAAALREWLTERSGQPADPLFPARRGGVMSRDAFQARLNQYKPAAAETCPSLASKKLAPHVLRHTAAMTSWRSGVDTSVIALWLGCAARRSCRIARSAGRDERSCLWI